MCMHTLSDNEKCTLGWYKGFPQYLLVRACQVYTQSRSQEYAKQRSFVESISVNYDTDRQTDA